MCGLVKMIIISPIKVIRVILNKLENSEQTCKFFARKIYYPISHAKIHPPTFGPCAVHAVCVCVCTEAVGVHLQCQTQSD